MCGFTGYLGPKAESGGRDAVEAMADTLVHRGPDDAGVWTDPSAGVALGHRRLSIIDLSPLGHQPMASASGRYVIAYNGEVYNFRELRSGLEKAGHTFRGHSDTEVMLAAFEAYGIGEALTRFVGMFAFALWDREERTLTLARDRMGEKPLYYGWMGDTFLFGSELKALTAHPGWAGEIDRDALALLLRHNYVPAPHAIYRGIRKLTPGSTLTIGPGQVGELPEPVPYWSLRQVAEEGVANPFEGDEAAATDELERLLRTAIRDQMLADVPLGAFLSGGIDSSTVVALMQAESERPVKTFTIGFHEAGYDEAPHGRAVAEHLGTEHTELYVTPEEAREVIPRLPTLYDEPFSDVSQIPTCLVSRMAREHVTVSLSGDGGDELFCGYARYGIAHDTWRRASRLPAALRLPLAALLEALPVEAWNAALGWARPFLSRYGQSSMGDKLHAAAGILKAPTQEAIYGRLVSHWTDPARVVPGGMEPPTALTDRGRWANVPDYLERMSYWDMVSYLPDDILVKVDRAAMGVSLEGREPLLDHRVVAFSWRVPLSMKVKDGKSKWLLRQVLYRHVPRTLIERPKMGFGVPIGQWLSGPLRDWAEDLLDETKLREQGYFDPAIVHKRWRQHLSGSRNAQYLLWDIVAFQSWLAGTARSGQRGGSQG